MPEAGQLARSGGPHDLRPDTYHLSTDKYRRLGSRQANWQAGRPRDLRPDEHLLSTDEYPNNRTKSISASKKYRFGSKKNLSIEKSRHFW